MNRWKLAAGLPLALMLVLGVSLPTTACLEPTAADAEGSCVATVMIQGTAYHFYGTVEPVPAGFDPGTPYATVAAFRECVDVIVYAAREPTSTYELRDGESNYLQAGTPLYAIPGTDPTRRLVVRAEDGSWLSWVAAEQPTG